MLKLFPSLMKLSLEWGKVRKYSELSQKDEFFLISNILCPGQQMLFHLENMEGNSRLIFNVILSKTKQQHFRLMLKWLLWFSFVFVLFILLLAMSCSMWNLSSLTRDWTCAPCSESRVFTAGLPGKFHLSVFQFPYL